MKRIISIGLAVLVFGLQGSLVFTGNSGSFKHGSKPDGFRDIKWGTDISTLQGMKRFFRQVEYEGIKIYTKKDEILFIGRAKPKRIEYGFWKGKFCSLLIRIEGYENWLALKETVFEKFGRGYRAKGTGVYTDIYSWHSVTNKSEDTTFTCMKLRYYSGIFQDYGWFHTYAPKIFENTAIRPLHFR